jgi:hypothetical protein
MGTKGEAPRDATGQSSCIPWRHVQQATDRSVMPRDTAGLSDCIPWRHVWRVASGSTTPSDTVELSNSSLWLHLRWAALKDEICPLTHVLSGGLALRVTQLSIAVRRQQELSLKKT